jgi:hypothetical protein
MLRKQVAGGLAVLIVVVGGIASAKDLTRSSRHHDERVTSRYLHIKYELARADLAAISEVRVRIKQYVDHVLNECPRALSNVPMSDGRQRESWGTGSRLGIINELLDGVAVADIRAGLRSARIRNLLRATTGLRWHDAFLNRLVAIKADEENAWAKLAGPQICDDLKTWAKSHYGALPASTRHFLRQWKAVGDQTRAKLLGLGIRATHALYADVLIRKRLTRYESGPDRLLAKRLTSLQSSLAGDYAALTLNRTAMLRHGLEGRRKS